MKKFEELMQDWKSILEGIENPVHKEILSRIHSDLAHEIPEVLEYNNSEPTFENIIKYIKSYLATSLVVGVNMSEKISIIEYAYNVQLDTYKLFNDISIEYSIEEYMTLEELNDCAKESECSIEELVKDCYLSFKITCNDEQMAVLKLTESTHYVGRVSGEIIGTDSIYINGEFYDIYLD